MRLGGKILPNAGRKHTSSPTAELTHPTFNVGLKLLLYPACSSVYVFQVFQFLRGLVVLYSGAHFSSSDLELYWGGFPDLDTDLPGIP